MSNVCVAHCYDEWVSGSNVGDRAAVLSGLTDDFRNIASL